MGLASCCLFVAVQVMFEYRQVQRLAYSPLSSSTITDKKEVICREEERRKGVNRRC